MVTRKLQFRVYKTSIDSPFTWIFSDWSMRPKRTRFPSKREGWRSAYWHEWLRGQCPGRLAGRALFHSNWAIRVKLDYTTETDGQRGHKWVSDSGHRQWQPICSEFSINVEKGRHGESARLLKAKSWAFRYAGTDCRIDQDRCFWSETAPMVQLILVTPLFFSLPSATKPIIEYVHCSPDPIRPF